MNKQTLLEKQAQERSFLNKLREKSNVSGRILESLNPEFEKMMNNLRATDEKSRAIASNLKQLVSSAKSAVNSRDYLGCAMALSAYHERLRYISHNLQKFVSSVNLKHYTFLLDQFDDDQKEKLFGYNPAKDIAMEEAATNDGMLSLAQMTFWNPLENESELVKDVDQKRRITMKAIEKRLNTSFMKDLKTDSISILNSSIRFLKFTIALFKKLASALATRDMKDYIKFANLFTERLNEKGSFHEEFVKYYQKNIVPLKEEHAKMLAAKQEADRLEQENKARELEEAAAQERAPKVAPLQEGESFPPTPKNMDSAPDSSSFGPSSFAPTKEVNVQEILKRSPYSARAPQVPQEEKEDLLNKLEMNDVEHQAEKAMKPGEQMPMPYQALTVANFISTLEKFAENKDPKSLVLEILSFSEELEDKNPNESLQLLAIAEGIMEDYKTAGLFDNLNNMPKPANDPSPKTTLKSVTPSLQKEPNKPATINEPKLPSFLASTLR